MESSQPRSLLPSSFAHALLPPFVSFSFDRSATGPSILFQAGQRNAMDPNRSRGLSSSTRARTTNRPSFKYFRKESICENIGDAIRATLRDELEKERRKAEKAGHKTRVHGCIYQQRPREVGREGGGRRGCCQLFSRGTNL